LEDCALFAHLGSLQFCRLNQLRPRTCIELLTLNWPREKEISSTHPHKSFFSRKRAIQRSIHQEDVSAIALNLSTVA
jgi:hypothetical protein